MDGQHTTYLRQHRIPTKPSKHLLFGQFLIISLVAIAVQITILALSIKLFILLILLYYAVILRRTFKQESEIAQHRFLILNDKDEWSLSSLDSVTQKLILEANSLILPGLLILYFRFEKRRYTFIYLKDNLPRELARILRVRLLNPVKSKHPLK